MFGDIYTEAIKLAFTWQIYVQMHCFPDANNLSPKSTIILEIGPVLQDTKLSLTFEHFALLFDMFTIDGFFVWLKKNKRICSWEYINEIHVYASFYKISLSYFHVHMYVHLIVSNIYWLHYYSKRNCGIYIAEAPVQVRRKSFVPYTCNIILHFFVKYTL